ncbi:MAG: class I SAM-dependent methyltransferase [Proteobacteria bacterium]|nr:class I SAM-dependent methyltransferase [Pseudomonadota bacterium]
MTTHVPSHLVEEGQDEAIAKLNEKLAQFPVFVSQECQLTMELFYDPPLKIGGKIEAKIYAVQNGHKTDLAFPDKLIATAGVWGVDENAASLLTSLVQVFRPKTILETGTNRGRSTRAILDGMELVGGGHLWTVDMIDYKFHKAVTDSQSHLVTQVIGESPDVLGKIAADENFKGLRFAFLDGGHEYGTLLAELQFCYEHAAPECWVLCDNSRDKMWGEGVTQAVKDFCEATESERISLDTLCGMELIRMDKTCETS